MLSAHIKTAQLEQIRAVPFVRRARFISAKPSADHGDDGILEITTPRGPQHFSVLVKRSYLDRSLVNALIGQVHGRTNGRKGDHNSTFLFASYLPLPTARSFIEAGISFVDEAGNIHLALGEDYNWTVVGERRPTKPPEAERTTPAAVQLLFQLVTDPESAKWTVRDLAAAVGLSKSKVAQLRAQFAATGIFVGQGGETDLGVSRELKDRLVSSYNQILRPKLVLGRYRYPDKSAEEFVTRFSREAVARKIPYALTGGPAADAMLHLYRAPHVPLFIATADTATQRHFRLLPDYGGPVTLLRAFGPLVYWRDVEKKTLAPPWLVYAELLSSGDAREREVAEELRQQMLL